MIDTVTIAGAPADLVEAVVTVTHGRASFAAAPTASTASLSVLVPPTGLPTWAAGDTAEMTGPDGPRFAGRISDRRLTSILYRGQPAGRLNLTCMGRVARLGVRAVGDTPWPAEPAHERAARILRLALGDTGWRIEGTTDATVLARDVDAQPALQLLADLAATTGGAVFDTPAGDVFYQALAARQRPVFPWRWRDFDPGYRWADFDPALTWDGLPPSLGQWTSPDSVHPIDLPCTAVAWAPEWASADGAILNDVSVGWGPVPEGGQQATVTARDQASIDRHGRRHTHIGTQLAHEPDALARATHVITTQASDRWALSDVTVHLDKLHAQDPAAYLELMNAVCGRHIRLNGLPQPAPAGGQWTGILEGWTFTQWSDETGPRTQLVLTLSDPLHSLAVMRWADFPAVFTWADFPAWTTWDDLTDLPAIGWPTTPERTAA